MRTEPWETYMFKGWTQEETLKDRLRSFQSDKNIRKIRYYGSWWRRMLKAEGLEYV